MAAVLGPEVTFLSVREWSPPPGLYGLEGTGRRGGIMLYRVDPGPVVTCLNPAGGGGEYPLSGGAAATVMERIAVDLAKSRGLLPAGF